MVRFGELEEEDALCNIIVVALAETGCQKHQPAGKIGIPTDERS